MTDQPRRLEELTPQECLRLLSTISLGRVVFTARALPAVRLASHAVDNGQVIVRADRSAAITSAGKAAIGTVVAYQADAIDPADHLGWSATVVGVAQPVTDPDAAAAFRRAIPHWAGDTEDQFLAINPGVVTGFRLVSGCRPVAYDARRIAET